VDAHERATSVWYRVAGLVRRKELAIEIVEAEIRSAQYEVLLEAAKLVLSDEPIEIARKLRAMAERTIRPTGRTRLWSPPTYGRPSPSCFTPRSGRARAGGGAAQPRWPREGRSPRSRV
jgi:hypothetical protein